MREFENRVFQDKTIGKKFMDNYLKKVGSAPIRIIIIIILEFQGLTGPEILAPAGDCLALLEIMFASLTFSIIIMIIKKCLSPHLSLKMFVNKKCLSPLAVCKKCLSPRGETNCFVLPSYARA